MLLGTDSKIKSSAAQAVVTRVKPVKLSIVIAAYNEGQNVALVVEQSIQVLTANEWAGLYELILVDDGSTDETGQITRNLAQKYEDRVKVFHHPTNRGFGAALKTGFAHACGEYVTLIPGDGEVGVDQALKLFHDMGEADLMLSRRQRSVPTYRKALTGGFQLLTRWIIGADVSEMEGIYVIRGEVLKKLKLKSETGLVNFEILLQCRARGCLIKSGIMQASPRLSGQSKVANLPTVLKTLWEMFKLRLTLIREGYA